MRLIQNRLAPNTIDEKRNINSMIFRVAYNVYHGDVLLNVDILINEWYVF